MSHVEDMANYDVKVMGLVSGIHVLQDINMDVPHGVVVTIPALLATQSQDLWRAISQRLVTQVTTSATPVYQTKPNLDPERVRLETQFKEQTALVDSYKVELADIKKQLELAVQERDAAKAQTISTEKIRLQETQSLQKSLDELKASLKKSDHVENKLVEAPSSPAKATEIKTGAKVAVKELEAAEIAVEALKEEPVVETKSSKSKK